MRGGLKNGQELSGEDGWERERGGEGGGRETEKKRGICERQSLCEREKKKDDTKERSDRRNGKTSKTKHVREIQLNTHPYQFNVLTRHFYQTDCTITCVFLLGRVEG